MLGKSEKKERIYTYCKRPYDSFGYTEEWNEHKDAHLYVQKAKDFFGQNNYQKGFDFLKKATGAYEYYITPVLLEIIYRTKRINLKIATPEQAKQDIEMVITLGKGVSWRFIHYKNEEDERLVQDAQIKYQQCIAKQDKVFVYENTIKEQQQKIEDLVREIEKLKNKNNHLNGQFVKKVTELDNKNKHSEEEGLKLAKEKKETDEKVVELKEKLEQSEEKVVKFEEEKNKQFEEKVVELKKEKEESEKKVVELKEKNKQFEEKVVELKKEKEESEKKIVKFEEEKNKQFEEKVVKLKKEKEESEKKVVELKEKNKQSEAKVLKIESFIEKKQEENGFKELWEILHDKSGGNEKWYDDELTIQKKCNTNLRAENKRLAKQVECLTSEKIEKNKKIEGLESDNKKSKKVVIERVSYHLENLILEVNVITEQIKQGIMEKSMLIQCLKEFEGHIAKAKEQMATKIDEGVTQKKRKVKSLGNESTFFGDFVKTLTPSKKTKEFLGSFFNGYSKAGANMYFSTPKEKSRKVQSGLSKTPEKND